MEVKWRLAIRPTVKLPFSNNSRSAGWGFRNKPHNEIMGLVWEYKSENNSQGVDINLIPNKIHDPRDWRGLINGIFELKGSFWCVIHAKNISGKSQAEEGRKVT